MKHINVPRDRISEYPGFYGALAGSVLRLTRPLVSCNDTPLGGKS